MTDIFNPYHFRDPKEIAAKAKNILETKGWRQHWYDGNGYCITGAIAHVLDKNHLNRGIDILYRDYNNLWLGLEKIAGTPPVAFNDAPGRTKEEVIDLLQRFIDS